jgi:coenzyme F420-reducing hydrogenase alpha subunit
VNSSDVIEVPILTRVEGEGGVTVRLRDNSVEDVQLRIYEPPRLFEALLVGRALEEVPDITARMCGICPVAYQMSSVHALEAALRVQITPEIRQLRRLLYCGEWIESHALHMHLLHAPDFFGAASGIELARQFPKEMQRGLQLKKHGNRLLEALGGRAIHPINVAVGGFYRMPRRDELTMLIPDFEWGLAAAIEATRWVASFSYPDVRYDYEFVALSHPDEYPFNEGEILSSTGLRIPVTEFENHYHEIHVAHSTALQAVTADRKSAYFVGPLARLAMNFRQLDESVQRLADDIGWQATCRNPFRSLIARGLELVQVYHEALSILKAYRQPAASRISYAPVDGSGCAATEAPRGLLYHHYRIDQTGKIQSARIVPPTSQNQRQIETDLREYLNARLARQVPRDELALDCEKLVRTYDPCISCSTHFLPVKWEELT